MKTLTITIAAALLAVIGSWNVTEASAQGAAVGYLTDTRGGVVKDPFNACWRTGSWSPAMAVAECDPDLVSKPALMPAPRPAAQAAPAAPAAPAPRPAAPAAAPAPAAKPAAAAPKRCDATVTLQGDAVFGFNKAVLNAAAKAHLDKDVIGRIGSCARLDTVVIEGHTDRLGSQQYNQKLSEKRADNVKKYLVAKGVDASKVETIGMGKTVPAKFCPDSKNRKELIACLAPSRRAIVFIKGPGK